MNNAIFNNSNIFKVSEDDLKILAHSAEVAENGRFRICMHQSQCENIQEMIIAMARHSKLLPHRRKGKKRSYSILYGELELNLYDSNGNEVDKFILSHEQTRFVRLSQDYFILPVVKSDIVVFHEIAEGPFEAKDEYASWYKDNIGANYE